MAHNERICVVGLGYVGLPLALALADAFEGTIGFDINSSKVAELNSGNDRMGEADKQILQKTKLQMTANSDDISSCTVFIVAVPTPVTQAHIPDLKPIISASQLIAKHLKVGDVVVYESTVYPGVTEEICAPILAQYSGLMAFTDFKLAYSPERINPGDKERSLSKIVKVVAGQDAETTDRLAAIYGAVVSAGIHKAPSIKVAEAAKVIENTQRDLNIALMNELAIIFDRMKIRTSDVLDAAGTKWNFLRFTPGLVGGHCIGVDPYYLTHKAEELGYHPQVILAGRRINDSMGNFISQKAVKLMLQKHIDITTARVGILGLTFKENVPDIRNSKIPSIVNDLADYGISAKVCDPMASADETQHEYGITLSHETELDDLDLLILAVPHASFLLENAERVTRKLSLNGILLDIKSVINPQSLPASVTYWSL